MENKITEKEKLSAMALTTIIAVSMLAIVLVYNFLQDPSKTVFGKNQKNLTQNTSASTLEEAVLRSSFACVVGRSWRAAC